jgi:hypothetical protein
MIKNGKLAGVAQPVEQLICNQQVVGSNPSTSSIDKPALHKALRVFVFPIILLQKLHLFFIFEK